MGSVYAAGLHGAGHDVIAIDPWPAHVEAINASGLRVSGPRGEQVAAICAFTQVSDVPAEQVDLVIVAVKSAQAGAAAVRIAPLLSPTTIVLTIQNGL
ncbi:MAG TPA: 2-dehydropantoate 2-reductase, partial [Ilumatobacteraceae bacterium]|nr:2-dehydropantoate 2-reductase [Ilumatobacteraceae bacterium]